jgi:hypothetical protein
VQQAMSLVLGGARPATRTQGMPIQTTARTIDSSSREGCLCDSIPCLWSNQEQQELIVSGKIRHGD